MISKLLETDGVHRAHGLGKVNHLCFELFALGGVSRNVVDWGRVFSALRRLFDVGPVEPHAVGPAACGSTGAEKRAGAVGEQTLPR